MPKVSCLVYSAEEQAIQKINNRETRLAQQVTNFTQ